MHADIIRLENTRKYARYRKVDLHVHTPVSAWCWNQHRTNGALPAGKLTPEDVADAILATDLDLVAITDHDTVAWIDSVSRALARKARLVGRKVVLLPGIEITTYDGVHLLGIFPVDKSLSDLRNMLITFGLAADGVKSERANNNWPLEKVATEIEAQSGLVIAPHALEPKMGIWGGEKSEHKGKRKPWLENGSARILACSETQKDRLLTAIRNVGIQRQFSVIRHSDAHSFEEFGVNATYVKLAELTVEGLRQVIHEPELRVSFSVPAVPSHSRLLGVELDGGYFKHELLVFSEHLNTLIGTNYAGKSAVVDAIRYAFADRCFDDSVEQQRLLARIDGILSGGRVRVWFVGKDGHTYRVEREVSIAKSGRAPREHHQATVDPVLLRLEDEIEIPIDKPLSSLSSLLEIDFYGQGAVVRIAIEEESHRSLIDAMAGTAALASSLDATIDEPAQVIEELNANAQDTQEVEESAAGLRTQLDGLPDLLTQREALRSQAKNEVFASWKVWQDAGRAVDRLYTAIAELEAHESTSDDETEDHIPEELPDVSSQSSEVEALLAPIRRAVADLYSGIETARQTLQNEITRGVKQVRQAITAFRGGYKLHDDRVREQLATLKLSSQTALMKRIDQLSAQIEELEQKVRPKLGKAQQRLIELTAKRAHIAAQLSEEWGKLRGRRQTVVEFLNQATGDELVVEFLLGVDKTRFWKRLETVISSYGSRGTTVQKRDREIQLIVDQLDPPALVELLLAKQPDTLVAAAKVTQNTAEFLCNIPIAEKIRFLAAPADDSVVIKYQRPGEPNHTPLTALSPGERTLALLTVVFVNTKGPIVIDQPEDELGQALVTNQLVNTIRRGKQERQFIIVTHNANIPVLGDAEGIFCMRNDYDTEQSARKCYVGATGAIECEDVKAVLLGLEGGKESFIQRQAKYNITS